MTFLDVPGIRPSTLDTLVTARINDTASGTAGALKAGYAPRLNPPTTAATTKNWDPRTCVYNLDPSQLRRIRAALGKVMGNTGMAKIAFLGDSTVVGAYGGDSGKFSWPARVRQMLANQGYPSAGTGLVPCFNNYAAAEPRIILYSGETALHSWSNMMTNTTTVNGVQFDTTATGETGTILDVYYDDMSAPFDVNIDGGTKTRITPGGTNTVKVWSSATLSNTTHQGIAWRVSGTMNILGFQLRTGAYGVQTYNSAISGAKTDSIASSNYQHVAQTALNRTTGWGADLVFIMCETNDAGNAIPVATFKANMQTAINTAVTASTDIVLVTGFPLNGTDLTPYTKALYELADSNNLPLIDMQARWGSWTTANGLGLFTDNAHPTAAGYATAGRAIFTALGL